MISKPIELELRVRDVDRSVRFYRELGVDVGDPEVDEGQDVRHAHAAWGTWGKEDSFFLLTIYPAGDAEISCARFGLGVDDLDAIHERLSRAGIEVVRPPERKPWGRSASYRDPDGNVVGLTERPKK